MGRAEERKKAKQFAKKGKSMQEKMQDYRQLKSDIRQETYERAVAKALEMFLSCSTVVLHDEYGFGAKRLDVFLSKVNSQIECIYADTVKREEIVQLARDLTGREINWRKYYEEKWGMALDRVDTDRN